MVQPVRQGQVIHSEWIKLTTVRSTWFVLTATVAGVGGLGLLVSFINNNDWARMSAADRASFSPINQSLIGVTLAQLLIGVLGVLAATGEYGTGMVRATFAAVPRRVPVLVAKVCVLAAVTFTVCLGTVLVAFVGGQQLLGSHGISLSHPGAVRAVAGATLYLTVVAAASVGVGFLTRSTAGGIATVLGVLLVLPILVAALSGSAVQRYLPSSAGRAVFLTNGGEDMLSPWVGFGIFLLYAGGVLAAAALALRRRDA